VVQSAGGEFNFEDPVRRDVTPVVAGKNTVIRFETDNPGEKLHYYYARRGIDLRPQDRGCYIGKKAKTQ
jgi:hypothetical protein